MGVKYIILKRKTPALTTGEITPKNYLLIIFKNITIPNKEINVATNPVGGFKVMINTVNKVNFAKKL
jgi:hypothetical protein